MKKPSTLFAVLFAVVGLSKSFAQVGEETMKPVTRTYALKNVTIVVKPGQTISNGTVIVKDGLIHAVGQNIAIPPDAKVLPSDSLYVYAGFIDALGNTGIPKPEQPARPPGGPGGGGFRQPGLNPGAPSNELAGIQPELRARDLIKPTDKSIEDWRKLGFTSAHTMPYGRMLPGHTALVALGGSQADNMILRDNFAFSSQLTGAQTVYPNTVIAVISKYRELYKQAEQAKNHEKMYASNPGGMPRPEVDRSLQAFYPVIDKQRSVCFVAPDVKSIYRVMSLQQELGFPLILANVREGWHVADQIKAKNIPVILSLDLPKPEKKDAKKDSLIAKDAELKALEARRAAEMKSYETQAALFAQKGINFGFSTLNAKLPDVRESMRRMIKNGLKEDQMLAALTTTPAAMFGVSGSLGTVEKGKTANLVLSKKPYFDEKSQVRYVFVDGTPYEFEPEATAPAGRPSAGGAGAQASTAAKITGKWRYSIETPGQSFGGDMVFKDEGNGSLSGTWTTAQGETKSMENVKLSGNVVTFNSTVTMGQELALGFELSLEGNRLSGKVKAGDMGSFPIEASKTDPKE
jgi:imidazolonepropionase-like amidohydrolase